MAGHTHTGLTPFLVSPASGHGTPTSSYAGDHKAAAAAEAGDAGAAFVLESKGTWWHAGFHLTTAMVGPTVLTLPYALRGMGWGVGLMALTAVAAVTFYTYYLMSRVLDHCEAAGRRHIRFRELAADVLGSGWIFYLVVTVQTLINAGITIGSILIAGNCLQNDASHHNMVVEWDWRMCSTGHQGTIAVARWLAAGLVPSHYGCWISP